MELELSVEVLKPSGRVVRFAADAAPERVPQGLTFRTKRGEGFDSGGFSVSRHVLSESTDIELYDSVRIVDAQGTTVYEGRVAGLPRELGDEHSQEVELQGHMAVARDAPFREIYIDREMGGWEEPSNDRKAGMRLAGYELSGFETQKGFTGQTINTAVEGEWTVNFPASEAWYYGDGVDIGRVVYAWAKTATIDHTNTAWLWQIGVVDDDAPASLLADTGNLRAAGPGIGTLTVPVDGGKFAFAQLAFTSLGGAADTKYAIAWVGLAVLGTHGLALHNDPSGYAGLCVSDVIKNICERFMPGVSAGGVQATTFPLAHIAFKDLTDPYDAFMQLNGVHLWELAVWEGPTLHYYPSDLTHYDWQARVDDYGTGLSQHGDTIDELANGIVVEFDNVATGRKQILHPDDYGELRALEIDHPATTHGLRDYAKATVSMPASEATALQLGKSLLAEANQIKAPGSITIKDGYIQNRQGVDTPAYRVRATDTIVLADHPNDRPRLITETTYDNDSKTLTVTTDSTVKRVDAVIDRISGALAAQNISR